MKIKKLSLALGLLLALPSIGLISCSKKKEGYTVKVSVTDIGTAKVFVDSIKTGDAADNIKDSLVSKLNANKNGAKITSVKVTYIDEKGKKVEDKSQSLEVGKEFTKTYQVRTGKTIIVTATAEGSPVADTMIAREEFRKAALVWAAAAWTGLVAWKEELKDKKVKETVEAMEADKENQGWGWLAETLTKDAWKASGVPGKPAEVTLPTLSITIDKDGETIAAQSVKASKNGLQPKDLTTANKKTKVTATATAVAFDVK